MPQISENNNPITPEDIYHDEINIIEVIYPVYKRRKFLIIFCLTITFLVGIISVFSEKIYEAKTVILPETGERVNSAVAVPSVLEEFAAARLGRSSSAPAAIFGAVLKSNELAGHVLKRYDYYSIMGISQYNSKEEIAKAFAAQIKVSESNNDPSISISINSSDPVLASDLANSYVHALDEYNLTNSYTSTQRLREYIVRRLSVAEEELDKAQKELREFQEQNKAISIGKQTEATLEVLAEMESQKVALEVAKAAKEKFYKGPSNELEQIDAQIAAINKNITRLTNSQETSVPIELDNGKVNFYIPLTRIPALNYDESKLLLKVKAKTGVITMLTTQLEQVKLDETKDMPTINTLEIADPPQKAVKPKVKINVILGFIVSIFLGILIVFFMEFNERLDKDPESALKWKEMKLGFKHLLWLKRKKD